MKMLVFLTLLGLHSAAAVTHSLKYFYTASSQVPNFPEYVSVGMVDEDQIYYCDSNIRRSELKQDWMSRVTADDPQYLERETQTCVGNQPSFKANIDILRSRFNQTGGAHIVQQMYGCEWDDKTKEVTGFNQYGYDGEDFIALDLKTLTWIAPTPQAVITKHKWEKSGDSDYWNNYVTQTCVDWLKKYVNYGKSSLMRTDLPSVSLLQKTSSSPVSCLATGFYSQSAVMFWRKDGEELHDERGEILPNHDGSSQMSAILDLSSVKPEDWGKYECVFQLPGVKDVITKLEKAVIKSNEKKSTDMTIIIVAVVVVVALVLLAGIGFMVYKKRNDNKAKFLPASSDTSSEQSERLKPEA